MNPDFIRYLIDRRRADKEIKKLRLMLLIETDEQKIEDIKVMIDYCKLIPFKEYKILRKSVLGW